MPGYPKSWSQQFELPIQDDPGLARVTAGAPPGCIPHSSFVAVESVVLQYRNRFTSLVLHDDD